MPRTITESQFTELRRYEDGNPCWVNGGPVRSLVANGLIKSDGRARDMFVITPAGRDALATFRSRHGVA